MGFRTKFIFGRRPARALVLAWAILASRAVGAPAALEGELTASTIGGCRLSGPGASDAASRSQSFTASLLKRMPLGPKDWYLAGGVQTENFFFAGDPATPHRLQDCAAVVAVEYYRNGENVAALTLRPGWYFERRPVARAWDVPCDLISGVPLFPGIDGVIGVSLARFYHHPLPIFGLVATLGPRTHLQLVFPEPALIFSATPHTTWRLQGELTGTGFLRDSNPGRSVVEYSSYLVGVEFRHTSRTGTELAVGAGVEAVRNFDFFREQRRLHGSGAAYLKMSAKFAN